MTEVTIETINGKQCTVIKKPFDADWVKGQLDMGNSVLAEMRHTHARFLICGINKSNWIDYYTWDMGVVMEANIKSTITILPALPKHPKPADVPLLYRYASEGIRVLHTSQWICDSRRAIAEAEQEFAYTRCWDFLKGGQPRDSEITHATLDGERVEIALGEKL